MDIMITNSEINVEVVTTIPSTMVPMHVMQKNKMGSAIMIENTINDPFQ